MNSTLPYGDIIMGLGGGLALFLYGMRKMTGALKTVAGEGMKTLLGRLTANRFTGALAGALITAVIQSSSITTVLVVGFVTAGLMTFTQSVGVIIGANVGTTITAQIIALRITEFSLVMIAAGFFMELAARREKLRLYGGMLMGLGLLFFGMELMGQATDPLRSFQPFLSAMQNLRNPLAGIVLGATFTALVQSSSATTGIVIVFAAEGFVTLETGIALIFGANIGTCVTALLAAIDKPRAAVRAAMVHVIVNVVGVALWLAFIPQFADIVRHLSPLAADLAGSARVAAEAPRQIANAHTLFNVANLFIFIWLAGPLARLVQRLVPAREPVPPAGITPVWLDELFLDQPAIALDRVKLELVRLGNLVLEQVRDAFPTVTSGAHEQIAALRGRDEDVDVLHGAIITYLGKLSRRDLVDAQPDRLSRYIAAANDLENAGDVVEIALTADASRRVAKDVQISPATLKHLQGLHEAACESGRLALQAFAESSPDAAAAVQQSKAQFNALADRARNHLARRLIAEEPRRLETYRVESDIIENLKRLHTLFRRLARLELQAETHSQESAVPAAPTD